MRLRRSDPYGPGTQRTRRGFGYAGAEDRSLSDRTMKRIRALAIPHTGTTDDERRAIIDRAVIRLLRRTC